MARTWTPCFFSFVEAKRHYESEGDDVQLSMWCQICQMNQNCLPLWLQGCHWGMHPILTDWPEYCRELVLSGLKGKSSVPRQIHPLTKGLKTDCVCITPLSQGARFWGSTPWTWIFVTDACHSQLSVPSRLLINNCQGMHLWSCKELCVLHTPVTSFKGGTVLPLNHANSRGENHSTQKRIKSNLKWGIINCNQSGCSGFRLKGKVWS